MYVYPSSHTIGPSCGIGYNEMTFSVYGVYNVGKKSVLHLQDVRHIYSGPKVFIVYRLPGAPFTNMA